jgi:hypothetical protein
LFGYGSDAGKALQAAGGGKAFALRSHAGKQTRSQDRSGAREIGKEIMILVSFAEGVALITDATLLYCRR